MAPSGRYEGVYRPITPPWSGETKPYAGDNFEQNRRGLFHPNQIKEE